jgi:hypothetical protein
MLCEGATGATACTCRPCWRRVQRQHGLLRGHDLHRRRVRVPLDVPGAGRHDVHLVARLLRRAALPDAGQHRRHAVLHPRGRRVPRLERVLWHDELCERQVPVPPSRRPVPADAGLLQRHVLSRSLQRVAP